MQKDKYGTILVIDDNEAILTALRYCLSGTFQRIITKSSPDSVLTILNQEVVNLVLRAIRKHHPELPVVLITAYADVNLAVRGLKSGASDFITKPWDNDELVRKLKDVLDAADDMATLDEMEADHIRRAIDRCHGNMKLAAEQLGITRQTLYNKMKKLEV